jgi:hypothetical protein
VEHEGAARGIHVHAPRLLYERIHDSKDRVVDWWPSGGVAASVWLPARPAATWLRSRPPARLLTRRWRGCPVRPPARSLRDGVAAGADADACLCSQ